MRRLEAGESSTSGGIGLFGMIFVVFLALKLAEVGAVADWSWWWVTAPLWGPVLLVLIVSLVAAPFVVASHARQRRRQRDFLARTRNRGRW